MFSISDSCRLYCLPPLFLPTTALHHLALGSILVFSYLAHSSCILELNLLLFNFLTGPSNYCMSFYFWPPTFVFTHLALDYCIFPYGPGPLAILLSTPSTRIRLAQLHEVETKQSRKSIKQDAPRINDCLITWRDRARQLQKRHMLQTKQFN